MAGAGQLVGTAATMGMMMSSKDFKEGKEPVDSEMAVEAFKKLPVESWKYKDGIADGGRGIGPYAEDGVF